VIIWCRNACPYLLVTNLLKSALVVVNATLGNALFIFTLFRRVLTITIDQTTRSALSRGFVAVSLGLETIFTALAGSGNLTVTVVTFGALWAIRIRATWLYTTRSITNKFARALVVF